MGTRTCRAAYAGSVWIAVCVRILHVLNVGVEKARSNDNVFFLPSPPPSFPPPFFPSSSPPFLSPPLLFRLLPLLPPVSFFL